MNPSTVNQRTIAIGFGLGALVMLAFCLAIVAALDLDGWAPIAAAVFVALFSGGAIGALIAGRIDHPH